MAWYASHRGRSIRPTLCVILAAGASGFAQAPPQDDLEKELLALLNTPVQGASKRAQRMADSPQAIEVLTGDELRILGVQRLQDALKLMTSLDILETDIGYTAVGMRGVMQEGQPRTVQVLIDGVPLYTPLGGPVDLNNLPITVDQVERIEVVRGPSSTLYGANAVVGVIAITSRRAGAGFHGDLRVAGADKSTTRGGTALRFGGETWGISAGYQGASFGNSDYATYRMGSPSTRIVYNGGTGPGEQTDKGHQSQAHARADWKAGSSEFWISAGQAYKKLSPPGLPPVTFFNYRFYETDTALLGWRQSWAGSFITEVRFHRMRNRLSGGPSPLVSVVVGDPGWNSEYTWGDLTSDQIDLQANWNPSERLHFVFGADTRRMDAAKDPTHGLTEALKETASGAFATMDWETTSQSTLSLGFRAENESLGGSRVSPRLAFVWRPTGTAVLRAAYLTSSRSPQIFEQRINFAAHFPAPPFPTVYRILPNPDLKPEKTESFELGWRQQVSAFTLDLSLYRMNLKEMISQTTVTLGPPVDTQFRNSGDAVNQGAELALTWLPRQGWTLGANMAFVDFRRDTSISPLGRTFAYTPTVKANLWTRFVQGHWSGYAALQHVDGMDVEALQVYGAPFFDARKAHLQINGRVGYEFLKGMTFAIYGQNAARSNTPQGAAGPDRPVYFFGARREIGASLEYRF